MLRGTWEQPESEAIDLFFNIVAVSDFITPALIPVTTSILCF